MAKLAPEFKLKITNLQEDLLEIIDEARQTEFLILENFGENNQTLIVLEELTEITQQGRDLYLQLSRLRLQVAEAQPILSLDLLNLLTQRVNLIENRTPALSRSIIEIKTDWSIL
jgi:hypothetical protein